MTPGALQLEAAGTTMWLLPSGAVWWPAQRSLFAADLHLGKGAAFRAHGLPVPAGGSRRTLAQLLELAQAHGAERLVVLGDFWHSRAGVTAELMDDVATFARKLPTLLVLGNHDRHAHPDGLPIQAVSGTLPLGPLLAAHEPAPPEAPGFTLAGHLHPAVVLASRAGDRLRRPCFVHWPSGLVLPAFGALTGALTLRWRDLAAQRARVALVGDGALHWLAPD